MKKKGTVLIIVLVILFILLIILGIVAYTKLYVPKDYVMQISNGQSSDANVVYIYDNGKVIFNNSGINIYTTSMSEDDVQELLDAISDYTTDGEVYIIKTQDGTEYFVVNAFLDKVAEKTKVKDIFSEELEKTE